MTLNQDEKVDVLIDTKFFGFWEGLEITLSLDTFSSCRFSAPFEVNKLNVEPQRHEFRKTFTPFSFKPLTVLLHLEPLFVGTMVDVNPRIDANSRTVEVTGYSLPGVLNDCTAPVAFGKRVRSRLGKGAIPLEFKKLDLRQIAASLCEPYELEVLFHDPPGTPFERVAIKVDEKIHSFLAELAKQRNLVMTNTDKGELLFWRSITTGKPVAKFVAGESPLTSVTAQFNPQEYYSEITGFAAAHRRKAGSRYTYQNPFLPPPAFRPMSCKFDDTERGDAPEATRAKVGRMFANMASFTIDGIPTWRDPKGNLWKPNTTVTLLAPDVMCYRETEFLVRTVKLRQFANEVSASLELCLPGAFSGQIPEVLPWAE